MTSFDDFDFADNPDPRCPVVLVLDCSSSMGEPVGPNGEKPIEELNSGLDTLVTALNKDPLARRRVELSVVSFGTSAAVTAEFATVEKLILPTLVPSGITAMGAALELALDTLEERKRTYRANGVQYYRPWVLLITDGLPTDDTSTAAQRLKAAETNKSVAFFPVGIDGADMEALDTLGNRKALKLKGLSFDELFVWLSASQSRVSASAPGDAVALESPSGWAEV